MHQMKHKLTPKNIHNFGQKALHAGHVIGREVSETLSKVESVANAALPIASKLQPWRVTQSSKYKHVKISIVFET